MFNSKYFIYNLLYNIIVLFQYIEIGNFLRVATRATKLQCFRTNVSRVRVRVELIPPSLWQTGSPIQSRLMR